ncbi:hypothetical protein GLOIN_2v1763149 [Rhizophagus clarus]|uniref:Uncharacterized protein n=1 Tax=Rhizophagus clarus TaxID=94130 RepID=A0A8H3M996_9GLOM|nr:hypothetical protein GLOIN_2v1763149 [Rhizophagus clarus]
MNRYVLLSFCLPALSAPLRFVKRQKSNVSGNSYPNLYIRVVDCPSRKKYCMIRVFESPNILEYGSRYPAVKDLGIGATNASKKVMRKGWVDREEVSVTLSNIFDEIIPPSYLGIGLGYRIDKRDARYWEIMKRKVFIIDFLRQVDGAQNIISAFLSWELTQPSTEWWATCMYYVRQKMRNDLPVDLYVKRYKACRSVWKFSQHSREKLRKQGGNH